MARIGYIIYDLPRIEAQLLTTHGATHGLRRPNEGINQRNLKIWANADVADKICFGRT